jgi:hypothetical protein
MFQNFVGGFEEHQTFWATAGWYGFLFDCACVALVALCLACRTAGWLASQDRTDWVALITKLFFAPAGSGYLYLFDGDYQVIRSERACLVVMANEGGEGGSAYLVPTCERVLAGRITFHSCRPKKNAHFPRNIPLGGEPPVHRDIVGYHSGRFIFAQRPVAAGLLAALRRKEVNRRSWPV